MLNHRSPETGMGLPREKVYVEKIRGTMTEAWVVQPLEPQQCRGQGSYMEEEQSLGKRPGDCHIREAE